MKKRRAQKTFACNNNNNNNACIPELRAAPPAPGLNLPPLVEIGGRDLGPADSVSRASSWRRRRCRGIFCPTRKEIHRTRRSARARSAAATSGGPPPILYLARALGDGVGAGRFCPHREEVGATKPGCGSKRTVNR